MMSCTKTAVMHTGQQQWYFLKSHGSMECPFLNKTFPSSLMMGHDAMGTAVLHGARCCGRIFTGTLHTTQYHRNDIHNPAAVSRLKQLSAASTDPKRSHHYYSVLRP